jgi:Protein of unknown function (DUF3300)
MARRQVYERRNQVQAGYLSRLEHPSDLYHRSRGRDQPGLAYQSTASSYPGQGAPATAEKLQSVVAPIALYPDALVAQILSAATFPDQVADADYWLQQNRTLTGSALMTAVNKQTY